MPSKPRYSNFVEHPRYGRGPRFTTLVPKGDVYFGWHTEGRIPKTAVKADIDKQCPATMHVTHYFDLKRRCRDCDREFIFFAEEQKHWHEELQFGLDSDCVRCVPCRKSLQGVERTRQQYEEIFHVSQRTPDQSLLMAECALTLIEINVFSTKQNERVRMLLNQLPSGFDSERVALIRQRLQAIESENSD